MPDVPRSQLVAYAVGAVLVVVLGVWTLGDRGGGDGGGDRGAAFPTDTGGVSGAGADRADGGGPSGGAEGADAASGDASTTPTGGGAGAEVSVGTAAAGPVVVYVAGAVRHVGVYRLSDGDRVEDAVRRAGGPSSRADLTAVNLAAKLTDGQQIVVPRKLAGGGGGGAAGAAGGGTSGSGASGGAPSAEGADAGAGAAPGPPISLNSATEEQLETLDGVGPATAQKIIAWRLANGGFRTVDDLTQVSGIGPKRMEALRPHVQP